MAEHKQWPSFARLTMSATRGSLEPIADVIYTDLSFLNALNRSRAIPDSLCLTVFSPNHWDA